VFRPSTTPTVLVGDSVDRIGRPSDLPQSSATSPAACRRLPSLSIQCRCRTYPIAGTSKASIAVRSGATRPPHRSGPVGSPAEPPHIGPDRPVVRPTSILARRPPPSSPAVDGRVGATTDPERP
jgi:hypothetical protein